MSPDIKTAKKMADSLGVTVEVLSGGEKENNELPSEYLELVKELYEKNISVDKIRAMIHLLK